MNSSVRRVAAALGLVFLAVFGNLNYIQLGRSSHLSNHPLNDRSFREQIGRERGEIIAADGTILARSVPIDDPRYKFRRRYPMTDLMGHITGFYTPDRFCRSTGLELTYEDVLIGNDPPVLENFVDELLGRERRGHILRLTIDPRAQRLAARTLGDQRGSVAAIDPRTGAVLALYSTPSYNPNRVTRGHPEQCGPVRRELDEAPGNPLRFRAAEERFEPGSTMKIVTAAAALEDGATPSTRVPVRRRLALPDSDRTMGNFGGSSCGGSLALSFAVSCNTALAEFGLRVGAEKFAEMATGFGFNRPIGFDLPATASCVNSVPGGGCADASTLARPFVALSAIGQYNVGVTALQMARVAATVSNGGRRPNPYLVERVEDAQGAILRETTPQLSSRIYTRRTATQLKQLMIDVVRSGTGRVVGFRDGPRGIIGGKTGTAQTGGRDDPPHVWFVAFAPDVAVAVVVENGGHQRFNATGGRVAGPIAKAVLESLQGR